MKIPKNVWTFLPTLGIFVFIGISFYAASLYPGGSQADSTSVGFDWTNNFWCNLTSEFALNGEINPARPVAIFAMIVLCSSMTLFFFYFADYYVKSRIWKKAIKILGPISMLAAVLIFTRYHDVMTTILSVFGGVVIIGSIRALYKRNLNFLATSGIVCIILVGMNNLFYYVESLITYLPVIQKITFVLVLAWIIAQNLNMKNLKLLQEGE